MSRCFKKDTDVYVSLFTVMVPDCSLDKPTDCVREKPDRGVQGCKYT